MKILYAIQGTGNGHLSRAVDIIPELSKYGSVDILVSGTQVELSLSFPVRFKVGGLSFYFGKSGGINFAKTFREASLRKVYRDIRVLPVEKSDLVVNDFEPISAWACRQREVPCIALGHQASFLSENTPRPRFPDPVGEWILRNYAPAPRGVGFHFKAYDNGIYTPVIRKAVRQAKVIDKGHVTVYLPAFSEERLIPILGKLKSVKWHLFSKHTSRATYYRKITVRPVTNEDFVESIASSSAVLCGAGFETPAEALFLGKKLLVVPMSNQYEQRCNAAALKQMGVPVLKRLRKKKGWKLEEWLTSGHPRPVKYVDPVEKAVARVMDYYKAAS